MAKDKSDVDETEVAAPAEGDEGEPRAIAGAALQSALKKERKARQEAEATAKDLSDRLKKIEDAQLSDTERLRAELDTLRLEREQERTRNEQERSMRNRTEMVRAAAGKENFADPGDVVALLKGLDAIDSIEDEMDAAAAVRQLAQDKPHLLRQATTPTSAFEKILENGHARNPANEQGYVIPVAELNTMDDSQLAALKARDPILYQRSVAQVLSGPETYHSVG